MIIPPGQKKITPTQCREWVERCHDCHNGQIEVAFGVLNGITDVYRFPCKCQFPSNGYDLWQLENPALYSQRPVSYSCNQKEIPGHVFIHPSHAKGRMGIIRRLVNGIMDKRRQEQAEGDLPF